MTLAQSRGQRPPHRAARQISIRFSQMSVDTILDRPTFPDHWQPGIPTMFKRLNDLELSGLIRHLAFHDHPSWLVLKHAIISLLDHHWKRVHRIYHLLCVSGILNRFRLRYAVTPQGSVLIHLRCRFGRRLAESRPIQSPQFGISRDKALLSLLAGIMGCQPTPSNKLRAEDEQRRCFINRCVGFFARDMPLYFPRPSAFRVRKRRFELQLVLYAISATPSLMAQILPYFRRWLLETRQCGQSNTLRLGYTPEGSDGLDQVLYEAIYPYLVAALPLTAAA